MFWSPWQTNVLPTIIHADKMWIQDIIWVIVVSIACFWLVWSSLSRELFWTLFQTKSLIYFIEITNKISSFKNSFKKNGFSYKKKGWKIKLLSNWDHAWDFGEVYAKGISWPKLHWFDWIKHIIHNTFFTESEFTGLGKSSPSILVNNRAPPENVFFTTYGSSPTLWSNQWLLR